MMKKGKKHKSNNSNQIQIGFDLIVPNNTGLSNTPTALDSVKEVHSAKIVHMDSKAHLYRSILNRKME